MIITENINKRLGGQQILEGITFEVAAGEIVALIGPSGCGKTTLLRCLSLISPPDTGRLAIGSQFFNFPEQATAPWQAIYPELTVVFQQFPLWPHLTVNRNLLLPLELRGDTDAQQRIKVVSGALDIDSLLRRYPAELSVGQRQRVAFARALLLRPKYLLLDEITSAQDVEHIKALMALITQLAKDGTCVVLATHLIRFARHLATRFHFIDHGRIVESGQSSDLLAPKTERLKDFLLVGDEL